MPLQNLEDTYQRYMTMRHPRNLDARPPQDKVRGLVNMINSDNPKQQAFGKLSLENYLRRPEVIQKFRTLPEAQQMGIKSMLNEVKYDGRSLR